MTTESRGNTERRALLSYPPDDIRRRATAAWADLRGSGWRLAEALAIIDDKELWRGYGCESMRQYVALDFEGRLDRNWSHFLKAGRLLLGADAATAAMLAGVPVWNAIEAMPALEKPETREGAMKLLASGATSAQMRRHVATVRTDLHQPTEHRSVVVPDGTGISAQPVEQDVQQQWARLMNVAAYFCEKRDPSIGDKIEWLSAQILVDGYHQLIDGAVFSRWAQYQPQGRAYPGINGLIAQIESGRICCLFWQRGVHDDGCGGWNINDIQYHHVRPRSQGGHDGPVAPVCGMHHQRITENANGWTWREWAEFLGFGPEVWGQQAPDFVAPAGEGEEA